MNIQKTFKSKLIFNKFAITKIIAKGSYGEVYLARNKIDNQNYALKFERLQKGGESLLKHETCILLLLKGPGLPSVISFGVSNGYHILVENLLGKSIYDIWLSQRKKISIKDLSMFAIQAIERIEYVHSKNFLHRDIKPANFLVGNPDKSQIFLIDFGFARKYKSGRTGKYLQHSKKDTLFGTPLYLSLNALRGIEQTRKDELESLGLVFIFLFTSTLPWYRLKCKSIGDKIKKIIEIKTKISLKELCNLMPIEMFEYMNYVNNMNYEDIPDYSYLKNLFLNILLKMGENNDLMFSWINKKIIPKRIKNSLGKSKKTIYNNILNSLSNKEMRNKNHELKKNINNTEYMINLNKINDSFFSDSLINPIKGMKDKKEKNYSKLKINQSDIKQNTFENNEFNNIDNISKIEKNNYSAIKKYNSNKLLLIQENKFQNIYVNENKTLLETENNQIKFEINQNIINQNNYFSSINSDNNSKTKKRNRLKLNSYVLNYKIPNSRRRNNNTKNSMDVRKINNYSNRIIYKSVFSKKSKPKININKNKNKKQIKKNAINLYTYMNSTNEKEKKNKHKNILYKSLFPRTIKSNESSIPVKKNLINLKNITSFESLIRIYKYKNINERYNYSNNMQ